MISLERQPLILEFGCGPGKHDPEAIGVDSLPYPGVDVVQDAFQVLASLPKSSVERISSYHFLEHVNDPARYLAECARVLKPGGTLITVVPHWSNPYFYSDPTHRNCWGLYSMSYFGEGSLFRGQVPKYQEALFHVTKVSLGFRSDLSFPVRNGLKRILNLVNCSRWLQEFYEENLAHLVGCYEIRYVLAKPRA